jgi:hypothetical protein
VASLDVKGRLGARRAGGLGGEGEDEAVEVGRIGFQIAEVLSAGGLFLRSG